MQPLIILGAGGNCMDILDAVDAINHVAPTYTVLGFLDDDPATMERQFFNKRVLGPLTDACRYTDALFVNGIGSSTSYPDKPECIRKTELAPGRFATIVHPGAVVSPSASLGPGTVLLANATVCARAVLDTHVMVLPQCVISHDCTVKSHAILASGAVLCGEVAVEEGCYLGAASVVLGGLEVGARSLVGAGSVVTRNVPPDTVVCGNPARPLRPAPPATR
ncbi:MAG: NeuD/PglB/VioB family sugar acetyltransferase [Deltaproteobacteria bacterium]|nr:NeuD/PglB/VioB family sugar acetyltransferase [Deltaproteobacteria bacterium]